MEPETNEENDESTEQEAQEQAEETFHFKLRDLRPEKDPIGAGRNRAAQRTGGGFLR